MSLNFHLAIATAMEIATVIVVHQIVTAIASVTVTVTKYLIDLRKNKGV